MTQLTDEEINAIIVDKSLGGEAQEKIVRKAIA